MASASSPSTGFVPLHKPMSYREDELLALSGVQHFVFCPRQWALIHVEQQWAENERTIEGDIVHERCHDASVRERRGNMLVVRGLYVVSHDLGLSGICDVVEFHADADGAELFGEKGRWRPVPVEYKRGRRKPGDEDRVQVCAQAMALEESFCCDVERGYLYYDSERRREELCFDEQLRQETIKASEKMHALFRRGVTPPTRERAGCKRCSLLDICAPEIACAEKVDDYMERMLGGDAP